MDKKYAASPQPSLPVFAGWLYWREGALPGGPRTVRQPPQIRSLLLKLPLRRCPQVPAESPAVVIPVPPPNPVQVPQVQRPQVQTPQVQTPQAQTPQALVPKSPQPKPLPQTDVQTVQVYWVKDASGKFEGVPTKVAVKQADKPDAALQAAFNSLLAGPKDGTVSSEIPNGTKLRGLSVKNDGVYVDLSAEFTSGGGSNSMTGRLGQVIYTATSLQPNTKVWISVEGKPLELLGGEGLEVAQPSTRQSFDKNFPL
ncbi:GerMN domain-containing protein [Microcoleus vaginatus]|uniref:GerMN domain-containing protein n=1 Tax=Microcoleus vaginatus TaxID=119532 RepID=UPI00403F9435